MPLKLKSIEISPYIYLFICLILFFLLFTPHPFLWLISIGTLLLLTKLMFVPFLPGIFFFIFFYHWIQASGVLFVSSYLGKPINDVYNIGTGDLACFLSLVGLVFLALGLKFWVDKIPPINFDFIKEKSREINLNKVFLLYIFWFFLYNFLREYAFLFLSTTQIILRVALLKWVIVCIFAFVSILNKKKIWLFALIVAFEFIFGFLSYFSNFKTVIFFVAIILFSFIQKVKIKYLFFSLPVVLLLANLAFTWFAVKGSYRKFLNKGTSTQTVQVSSTEALKKVYTLVNELPPDVKEKAVKLAFERIAYTHFLARTMNYVPKKQPHEKGKLLFNNATYNLIPRVIYPSKPIKNDLAKFDKYTGDNLVKLTKGVSISLGYFTDAYIDFGKFGMFGIIYLYGFAIGAMMYYFFTNIKQNIIVKFAFINVILYDFIYLENDGVTFWGIVFLNLVYYSIVYFLFFRYIIKYIYIKN